MRAVRDARVRRRRAAAARRLFYVASWVVYRALSLVLLPLPPLVPAMVTLAGIGFVVGADDLFGGRSTRRRRRLWCGNILLGTYALANAPARNLYATSSAQSP